jgi:hypothetical protein
MEQRFIARHCRAAISMRARHRHIVIAREGHASLNGMGLI